MAAENRGPELAAVIIFLLAFTLVTVSLRCYTMAYLLKRFTAEDWLAVTTQVFYVAYSTFALLAIRYGLGRHVADVPVNDRSKALLFKWLGLITYALIAVLVKFIIGLFLLRICSQQRWQRITIWVLLGVVAVFNTFYILIGIFECIPVDYYWHRYDQKSHIKGKCSNRRLAAIPTYISLILNVLTDWTLALLPASFIWNAKMRIRMKISVSAVLGLGSIASIATVARIPYAKQILSNPDYLYNFTDLAIWSTVEIGLGLSASSLATLKPLFRQVKKLASTYSGSRFTNSTSSGLHGTGNSSGKAIKKLRPNSILFSSQNFSIIVDDTCESRKERSTTQTTTNKVADVEMADLSFRNKETGETASG